MTALGSARAPRDASAPARPHVTRNALVALLSALFVALAASPAAAQLHVAARDQGVTMTGLELTSERAEVVIDRQHATTTLTHEYTNGTGATVEGLFSFRAGDGANVDGFAYWNGTQKIVGEVLERTQAKAIYESTTVRRKDPGLLEKTAEGTFTFRVFPIQPAEKKRVEIRVDQWLERRSRVVEYRLPLTRANAELNVVISDERAIRRVRSTTHELDVAGDGTKRVAVRVGPATAAGERAKELVLSYELADGHFQPTAVIHRDGEKNGYFVLTLAAPKASAKLSQDLTLVVDGSSTEAGAQARLAAAVLVQAARASDRLNVVIAGADFRPKRLAERPVWVTNDLKKEALDLLLQKPGASADVAAALKTAMSAQEGTGRNRTIVLLSGTAPAGRDLLATARWNEAGTRVFTVGFGRSVDRAAFGALAAESRGRFLLVENKAALRPRIDRLAQQIAAPVLVDLALEVQGAEVAQVYPRTLPDLYQEQEIRIVGRIRGSGPVRLALRGRADKEVRLVASADLPNAVRRPFVAKLWGRERVQHLLEEIALQGETRDRVDEAIELALAYNVVTPYTAFLAIPESELSAQARESLTSLRQQKLAVLSRHPDAEVALAGQLMASGGGGDRLASAPSPGSMDSPESASPMEPAVLERSGGCAGCATPGTDTGGRSGWAALAALVALARRRRGPRR